MACTPQLITLFYKLKQSVTSSLFLDWFDPDKPTFLKKDWSAESMVWILMQPDTDK